MNKKKNGILFLIILAIIGGMVAGLFGEIITRTYLLKDFYVPYISQEFDLASLNLGRSNLIIRNAKKVVVNQDVKVNETINSVRPALVGIYKKLNPNDKLAYYDLNNPLFVALTITSDGWLVALMPAKINNNFSAQNYIAITVNRRTYKIDKITKFKELSNNLVFFHLVKASNLLVKESVPRSDLSLGESLLVLNNFNDAVLTSISSLEKVPTVLSSDSLNVRLALTNGLGDSYKSSFVFNLAGNLVALVDSNKHIIPAFVYDNYWRRFLNKKNVSQPYLGVNYLDLSNIKPLDLKLSKGAWLYPSSTTPAVIKGSPAAKAGLKAGDIITWIDNQELNVDYDLADVISQYQPGEIITLSYRRADKDNKIEVKLGKLK